MKTMLAVYDSIEEGGETVSAIVAKECPACMMHLGYGARRKGVLVQVRHVSHILDQAYAAADKAG
jgi:Fe-S oxidoreductase